MDSPYYIYILFSEKHQRYYSGSSADPQKRLQSHNDSRNNGWTKRYAPWEIIHTEEFQTKKEALIREKWFKTGVGREFIKKIHADSN